VIDKEPRRRSDTAVHGASVRKDLVTQVLDCAFEVHRYLGPGLLESVYEKCLAIELNRRAIPFQRQCSCPIIYDNVQLDVGFRLDFLIDGHLILELKAVEQLTAVHHAQLLTYLRLSGFPIGLLVNFNVVLLKDGIRRVLR
jgi:GxxExxY protein